MNTTQTQKIVLTNRQKEAMKMIRESGENVIIEDGWLIYLSDSRRMPFKLTNREKVTVSDMAVVRSQMVRYKPEFEEGYRAERVAASKKHGDNAILLIQAGRFNDAQEVLAQANHEALNPKERIEMYKLID